MTRGTLRAEIVTWDELNFDDNLPSFPDQKFLAEGDSWFTISGLPAFNLLFELRFKKHTQIVNCALPGDTIKHMATIARNRNLREALTSPDFTWDAVLLSGGGNDLIDEAEDILLAKDERRSSAVSGPAKYCDHETLQRLIEDVQQGYRRIAGLRDADRSRSKGVPILAHTYDYATPRNVPARFFLGSFGPWLFHAFTRREIPSEDWVSLADYLTDKLADGLLALQHGPAPVENFYVVDTRNTLTRAELDSRGDSNDWQNEIHPNGAGYEKLARLIEPQIETLF